MALTDKEKQDGMTPLSYIVKSGAGTLSEVSGMTRTDKPGITRMKEMAIEEMKVFGIPVRES